MRAVTEIGNIFVKGRFRHFSQPAYGGPRTEVEYPKKVLILP
jgi:hypothetical protein